MKRKELKLSEMLRNEDHNMFYSPCVGDVKLVKSVVGGAIDCSYTDSNGCEGSIRFQSDGSLITGGNCLLFPSKSEFEEHPTDPRAAWSSWLSAKRRVYFFCSWQRQISEVADEILALNVEYELENTCRVERGAFAVFAMYGLIKNSYGGVVSYEQRRNGEAYYIEFDSEGNPRVTKGSECIDPIAFRTRENAERFIQDPNCVKLLKDFYMAW